MRCAIQFANLSRSTTGQIVIARNVLRCKPRSEGSDAWPFVKVDAADVGTLSRRAAGQGRPLSKVFAFLKLADVLLPKHTLEAHRCMRVLTHEDSFGGSVW